MSNFHDLIPDMIPILGRKVEITKRKDSKNFGYFCSNSRSINISPEDNNLYCKETLIHEMFHAGVKFSGLKNMLTDDLEEALAEMVEGVFSDHIDFKFEKI